MSHNVKKTISYLKRNGIPKTIVQVKERIGQMHTESDYQEEHKKNMADAATLVKQSEVKFENPVKISILVPAYETPEDYLRAMIDSVLVQSYENFELCIADASKDTQVSNIIAEYDDERIVYQHLTENRGISGNTNEALKMATGDYFAFMDHDDYVEPDALFYIVKEINKGALCVYTDEDKVDAKGEVFFSPHRKEKFNLDLFLSNNYICHLFAAKRELVLQTGGLRSEFDGAQDYDMILRCVENIPAEQIHHVEKVLYHWRAHENSTAENPESKMYAYEAGRRVLTDYLKRRSLSGIVSHTEHLGFYRIEYQDHEIIDKLIADCEHRHIRLQWSEKYKSITMQQLHTLCGYFARPEVGAVGVRIAGRFGRTEHSAMKKLENGKYRDLYEGLFKYESGYLHRAALQQDADAVSIDAIIFRQEFEKQMEEASKLPEDEGSIFFSEALREKGYLVVYDPMMEAKLK